jgi:hypothetical protein
VAGRWFSLGTTDSSTNKTDRHDITEKLLKVAIKTKFEDKNLKMIRISLLKLSKFVL